MNRHPFWQSIIILLPFLANTLGPIPTAKAEPIYSVEGEFHLPAPGILVHLSPLLNPPILKGIKVHPENPFKFDFILDQGDSELDNDQLKDESSKLIKYFLASLTIPEKDLWVNLSPYEKDRIIPQSFGLTEMGRDLLAEDYMLKQVTASLIYPEDTIGKKFWKRIYEEAAKKFGTTNIPVNTFNKVWIVPEKAVVYENAKAGTAYVVESRLKVMLEQDYLSMQKHALVLHSANLSETSSIGANIVREIVIPELTKEVNQDKNFSQLRQVYNSLILATWYKKKIQDSILNEVYENKNKVAGVNINDPQEKQKIYERYLQAFKKGAYNYIKEETDPITQEIIPRKYFSGGVSLSNKAMLVALVETEDKAALSNTEYDHDVIISAQVNQAMQKDAAMNVPVQVDLKKDKAMPGSVFDRLSGRFPIIRRLIQRKINMQDLPNTASTFQGEPLTFGGGAAMQTLLSDELREKIMNNPDGFYVSLDDEKRPILLPKPILPSNQQEWITEDTPLTNYNSDFDLFNRIKKQHQKNLSNNAVRKIIIVEAGVGKGKGIVQLHNELVKAGIPHHIYGISSDYYSEWQKAPEGITFILSDIMAIRSFIAPDSTDIIFSHAGLVHFFIPKEVHKRKRTGQNPELLNEIKSVLRPGGILTMSEFIEDDLIRLGGILYGNFVEIWGKTFSRRESPLTTEHGYVLELQKEDNAQLSREVGRNNVDAAMPATPGLSDEQLGQFSADLLEIVHSIIGKSKEPDSISPAQARKDLIIILSRTNGPRAKQDIEKLLLSDDKGANFGKEILEIVGKYMRVSEVGRIIAGLDHYLGSPYGDAFIAEAGMGYAPENTFLLEDEKPGFQQIKLTDAQRGEVAGLAKGILANFDPMMESLNKITESFSQGRDLRPEDKLELNTRFTKFNKYQKGLQQRQDSMSPAKQMLMRTLTIAFTYEDSRKRPRSNTKWDIPGAVNIVKMLMDLKFDKEYFEVASTEFDSLKHIQKFLNYLAEGNPIEIITPVPRMGSIDLPLPTIDPRPSIDAAMKSNMEHEIPDTFKRGGIDLTSDKAFSVRNNGQGIKFHIDPAMLKQLQDAPGFTPVIINVQPLKSLTVFLGIN